MDTLSVCAFIVPKSLSFLATVTRFFQTRAIYIYICRDGYPECCAKDRGNCPINTVPDCECESISCNPQCTWHGVDDYEGCSGDKICVITSGDCALGIDPVEGFCFSPPSVCTLMCIYDPVCGCDNVSYDNACNAYATGVNIQHTGCCVKDSNCS